MFYLNIISTFMTVLLLAFTVLRIIEPSILIQSIVLFWLGVRMTEEVIQSARKLNK